MKRRLNERQDRIHWQAWHIVVTVSAALCVTASIAASGLYMVTLLEQASPVAEDDEGHAVIVDELRQVVLSFDDGSSAEYVMHHDDVDGFIRGVRRLGDPEMNSIVIYRMRRGWPSSWTREEMNTLFGRDYAPVYEWSLQESIVRIDD